MRQRLSYLAKIIRGMFDGVKPRHPILVFVSAIKDLCHIVISLWENNSSKKLLKAQNDQTFTPMMSVCEHLSTTVISRHCLDTLKA